MGPDVMTVPVSWVKSSRGRSVNGDNHREQGSSVIYGACDRVLSSKAGITGKKDTKITLRTIIFKKREQKEHHHHNALGMKSKMFWRDYRWTSCHGRYTEVRLRYRYSPKYHLSPLHFSQCSSQGLKVPDFRLNSPAFVFFWETLEEDPPRFIWSFFSR